MKRFFCRPAAIALALTIGAGCADHVASGGTDVGNGLIAGRIVDSLGKPAAGASVRLMHQNYDPFGSARSSSGSVLSTIAGIDGRFVFAVPDTGTYTLKANMGRNALSIRRGIRTIGYDTVFSEPGTLRRSGTIRITLPETGIAAGSYFYLPGTGSIALVDSAAIAVRLVELDHVPSGTMPPLFFRPSAGSPILLTLLDEFELSEDSVLELEFPEDPIDTLDYENQID